MPFPEEFRYQQCNRHSPGVNAKTVDNLLEHLTSRAGLDLTLVRVVCWFALGVDLEQGR
jgi:hypothetical protein